MGVVSTQTYREVIFMQKRLTMLEEIGQMIRQTRKAQGLKQVELAGYANVGARFIIELEAGKPTIQMGKALKVLEALGCKVHVVPPPRPEHKP